MPNLHMRVHVCPGAGTETRGVNGATGYGGVAVGDNRGKWQGVSDPRGEWGKGGALI